MISIIILQLIIIMTDLAGIINKISSNVALELSKLMIIVAPSLKPRPSSLRVGGLCYNLSVADVSRNYIGLLATFAISLGLFIRTCNQTCMSLDRAELRRCCCKVSRAWPSDATNRVR